jgi:predicted nucleic acid-binding protein
VNRPSIGSTNAILPEICIRRYSLTWMTMLEAINVEQRYRLSFWDALIVVAAQKGGASVLFSEDFNDGQKFGKVQFKNPFLGQE